jgi:hypothetical protein
MLTAVPSAVTVHIFRLAFAAFSRHFLPVWLGPLHSFYQPRSIPLDISNDFWCLPEEKPKLLWPIFLNVH